MNDVQKYVPRYTTTVVDKPILIPDDASKANEVYTAYIESLIRSRKPLPSGNVYINRPLKINKNDCAILGGVGSTTIIAPPSGPAIEAFSAGLGYTSEADIDYKLVPGDWVYWYRYNGYNDSIGQMSQLSQVKSINPLVTYPPKQDVHSAIKVYRRAVPITSASSDSSVVLIQNRPDWIVPGLKVFLTDGPSIANESNGEWRTIASIGDGYVRLDASPEGSYFNPVIADIEPIENLEIRNVRFVGHPQNTAGFKGILNAVFENVDFSGIWYTTVSSHLYFSGCGGNLLINSSADVFIQSDKLGHRFSAISGEEGTRRVTVSNCDVGTPGYLGIHWDANTKCKQLFLHNCVVRGGVHGVGPDCVLQNVELVGSDYSYVGGDRLSLCQVNSKTGLIVTEGLDCFLNSVRSPYLELRDGSEGSAVGVSSGMLVPSTRWRLVACSPTSKSCTGNYKFKQRTPPRVTLSSIMNSMK